MEVKYLKELLAEKTKEWSQMIKDQALESAERSVDRLLHERELAERQQEIAKLTQDCSDLLQINAQIKQEKETQIAELQYNLQREHELHQLELQQVKAEVAEKRKEESANSSTQKYDHGISSLPAEASQLFGQNDFPSLSQQYAHAFLENEHIMSSIHSDPPATKRVVNQLYNVSVEFHVEGVTPFKVCAILDTGATTCCINRKIVPAEALHALNYTACFNG